MNDKGFARTLITPPADRLAESMHCKATKKVHEVA